MPVVPFTAGTPLPDQIYVDSNVVVAFFYRTHTNHTLAATFFLESLTQAKGLVFSHLTLDELWYVLLMTWHTDAKGTRFKVKNPAHVSAFAGQLDQAMQHLLGLSNVRLFSSNLANDVATRALDELKAHNLGPRDAFHLANINIAGLTAMATADTDFDRVLSTNPGLTILRIA